MHPPWPSHHSSRRVTSRAVKVPPLPLGPRRPIRRISTVCCLGYLPSPPSCLPSTSSTIQHCHQRGRKVLLSSRITPLCYRRLHTCHPPNQTGKLMGCRCNHLPKILIRYPHSRLLRVRFPTKTYTALVHGTRDKGSQPARYTNGKGIWRQQVDQSALPSPSNTLRNKDFLRLLSRPTARCPARFLVVTSKDRFNVGFPTRYNDKGPRPAPTRCPLRT